MTEVEDIAAHTRTVFETILKSSLGHRETAGTCRRAHANHFGRLGPVIAWGDRCWGAQKLKQPCGLHARRPLCRVPGHSSQ